MPSVMLKPVTNRPPVVIAALAIVALAAFFLVDRLVTRFAEQQKALARHLYAQGEADVNGGHPDRAIEEFRAALLYSRDNFSYQLSLARALRDTGRTAESESYLVSLWERSPQDAAVNLALGRLAARQNQVDKTIQYYHNAIYGVWLADADARRLSAWFELIDFLLRQNARPQAQAELITLGAELPHDPELHLRVAGLWMRAQDYEHALAEYDRVLQLRRNDPAALFGAGQAAFHLGRYRTAERYLQNVAKLHPDDAAASELLELTNLVMNSDPFLQRIPAHEQERRMRAAFVLAGKRLDGCLDSQSKSPPDASSSATAQSPPNDLASLKTQWEAMQPKVDRHADPDLLDSAMDLVFQIEQQTSAACGAPTGADQALLLLSQNPGGVVR
jgi:tetratricopeptide (TPR) repeat protein